MGATPPLPPDDDSQAEGPTLPSTPAGNYPPSETPRAPSDQDSTLGRDPQSTLISLMNQREGDPMNLGLRDQEHAAFSRYMLARLGPVLGPAVVAASVPTYSAAKAVAQPLGFMRDATPASLREVRAGLSPLWGGGAPAGPVQPPQPQQQQQPQMPQLAQLYTLLRLAGVIR